MKDSSESSVWLRNARAISPIRSAAGSLGTGLRPATVGQPQIQAHHGAPGKQLLETQLVCMRLQVRHPVLAQAKPRPHLGRGQATVLSCRTQKLAQLGSGQQRLRRHPVHPRLRRTTRHHSAQGGRRMNQSLRPALSSADRSSKVCSAAWQACLDDEAGHRLVRYLGRQAQQGFLLWRRPKVDSDSAGGGGHVKTLQARRVFMNRADDDGHGHQVEVTLPACHDTQVSMQALGSRRLQTDRQTAGSPPTKLRLALNSARRLASQARRRVASSRP